MKLKFKYKVVAEDKFIRSRRWANLIKTSEVVSSSLILLLIKHNNHSRRIINGKIVLSWVHERGAIPGEFPHLIEFAHHLVDNLVHHSIVLSDAPELLYPKVLKILIYIDVLLEELVLARQVPQLLLQSQQLLLRRVALDLLPL